MTLSIYRHQTIDFHQVLRQLSAELDAAHHAFSVNPNASNWRQMQAAMLAYQQGQYLRNPDREDQRSCIVASAVSMGREHWGELVVMTATGLTIAACLQEAA